MMGHPVPRQQPVSSLLSASIRQREGPGQSLIALEKRPGPIFERAEKRVLSCRTDWSTLPMPAWITQDNSYLAATLVTPT